MKVYIVGIGMDGVSTLTREAEKAIEEAGFLIGAERMLRPFMQSGKETYVSYVPGDMAGKLNSCSSDAAAVLMSGDSGFFSGTKKLLPLLERHDVRVIPGISSLSYMCSRTGISCEDVKAVSLHGRKASVALNVKLNRYCFFLLGGDMSSADVCRRLCEYGMPEVKVHIGSDLGYPEECVLSGTAGEFAEKETGKLTVMLTENDGCLRYIPSAIPDESFTRSSVPMTKAEVRCIAVSKLRICRDSVVWDIGSGTGSVSVEAAFRCQDGRVLVFDKKTEASELTAENARHFGCDNIDVINGSCPEVLSDAETPDCVFIGGSSGNMESIFDEIHRRDHAASVVVTAVSLETLHEAADCFAKYGTGPEIVQIAVTRAEKLLGHTMMRAQNPVFIISGRLS